MNYNTIFIIGCAVCCKLPRSVLTRKRCFLKTANSTKEYLPLAKSKGGWFVVNLSLYSMICALCRNFSQPPSHRPPPGTCCQPAATRRPLPAALQLPACHRMPPACHPPLAYVNMCRYTYVYIYIYTYHIPFVNHKYTYIYIYKYIYTVCIHIVWSYVSIHMWYDSNKIQIRYVLRGRRD